MSDRSCARNKKKFVSNVTLGLIWDEVLAQQRSKQIFKRFQPKLQNKTFPLLLQPFLFSICNKEEYCSFRGIRVYFGMREFDNGEHREGILGILHFKPQDQLLSKPSHCEESISQECSLHCSVPI